MKVAHLKPRMLGRLSGFLFLGRWVSYPSQHPRQCLDFNRGPRQQPTNALAAKPSGKSFQTGPRAQSLRAAVQVVGGFLGFEVGLGDLFQGQVFPGELVRGLNGGAIGCVLHESCSK
jgi:hypothetical protein